MVDPSGHEETAVGQLGTTLVIGAVATAIVASIVEAKTHAIGSLLASTYKSLTAEAVFTTSAAATAVARVRTEEEVKVDVDELVGSLASAANTRIFLHSTTFDLWPALKTGRGVNIDPQKFNMPNDFGIGFYAWRLSDPTGLPDAFGWARQTPNGVRVGVIAIFAVQEIDWQTLDRYPAVPFQPNLIRANGLTGHDVVFGPLSSRGFGTQYKVESFRALRTLNFVGAVPIAE